MSGSAKPWTPASRLFLLMPHPSRPLRLYHSRGCFDLWARREAAEAPRGVCDVVPRVSTFAGPRRSKCPSRRSQTLRRPVHARRRRLSCRLFALRSLLLGRDRVPTTARSAWRHQKGGNKSKGRVVLWLAGQTPWFHKSVNQHRDMKKSKIRKFCCEGRPDSDSTISDECVTDGSMRQNGGGFSRRPP